MKLAITLSLAPLIVSADPFCQSLGDFAAQAGAQSKPSIELPFEGPRPDCSRSLDLRGVWSVTCGWGYAYRSDDASEAFHVLLDLIEVCGRYIGEDTAQVNHPDSYALHMFSIQETQISVSIKDKGALAQTWVFLRAGQN